MLSLVSPPSKPLNLGVIMGDLKHGIISASLFVSSYYIILSDNKSYALITENLQSM